MGADDFLKLIAVLIEYRLGAAEVVSHGQQIAADRLGMLADISVGDDQRLLDHGAGARREETIKPAVQRRAGDDGDEDSRHRRDHGEEPDDLNV